MYKKHRAYYIEEAEGAIYEIGDAAHRQRLESVEQWSKRVEVARLIIQVGIEAAGD